MGNEEHSLDVNKILKRIGDILDTNSASEIANALGVSRQVLSGWKKRKTIPWEKLWEFSHDTDLPLTYLLTGRHAEIFERPPEGSISPQLLEKISGELMIKASQIRKENEPQFEAFMVGPQFVYVIGCLYNKVAKNLKEDGTWILELREEIDYVLDIEKRTFLSHIEKEGIPPVLLDELQREWGDQRELLQPNRGQTASKENDD